MVGVAMTYYVKTWKGVVNTAIHDVFCKNTSTQIRVDF